MTTFFEETCACGNLLSQAIDSPGQGDRVVKVRRHPCQCLRPGSLKLRPPRIGIPDSVPRKQYEERRRVGLPIATDAEKAGEENWG